MFDKESRTISFDTDEAHGIKKPAYESKRTTDTLSDLLNEYSGAASEPAPKASVQQPVQAPVAEEPAQVPVTEEPVQAKIESPSPEIPEALAPEAEVSPLVFEEPALEAIVDALPEEAAAETEAPEASVEEAVEATADAPLSDYVDAVEATEAPAEAAAYEAAREGGDSSSLEDYVFGQNENPFEHAGTGFSRLHRESNSYKSHARPKKQPSYVTKKFLVFSLLLTLITSSALGGAIGAYFGSKGNILHTGAGSVQSVDKATGSPMTISEIIDLNENSVVEITTKVETMSYFGSVESEAAGSGVIVRDNGYIVTNYHVIEDSKSVSVRLHNGDSYPAQIVGYDQQNDIAVLKIDGKDFDAVDIGTSAELDVGDLAVAIGNPLGQLGGTATSGIISALDRQLIINNQTLTLLQTDSAINPGNSGGGLFNCKGELIGVVVAKSSGTGIEGLGFAIPIDTAKPIMDDIIENGKINTKPAAGITIAEISEDQLQTYGVDRAGVYITSVNGSNAKAAGLSAGDRIVEFEGEYIESSNQLIQAIQTHKIGDEVEFVVVRNGQQLSVRFALEDSSQFS